MSDPVADYIAAIPPEHRALFDRFVGLIRSVAPDVTARISYGIPTYEVEGKRLYVGVWKHGLSVYGWGSGKDGGLVERHPELKKSKGTIQLSPAAAEKIPDDELLTLVRAALT